MLSGLLCALTPALASAAAPVITSESVTNVGASNATLEASTESESAGTAYLEYGTSTRYESRIPSNSGARTIPAGTSTTSEPITGLQSDTLYHYRAVVTAGGATATGPDQTFRTRAAASGFTLPDDRDWELVSPPEKFGGRIESITREGGIIQAAEDGTAITYVSNAPITPDPDGSPSLADSQIMSVLAPGGGWSSRDLSTPHQGEPGGVPVGHLGEFYAFTPNLREGVVEPQGPAPQLAANAKENTIFIRENLREPIGAAYTALINDENTVPGTHYGNDEAGNPLVKYIAASTNLEHVVVSSSVPLTSAYNTGGDYEWTKGTLTPITIVNGELLGGAVGVGIGDHSINVRNAISEDGNRVFWTREVGENHLYMREVAPGRTVQIDVPQVNVPPPTESPQPLFMYATPSGERVYFKDRQRLTTDATAENGRPDLYEYNTEAPEGKRLTDLTPGTEGVGAGVLGEVIGASDNGEYVYFVANGALAPGAPAGECFEGAPASNVCGLYVERVVGESHTISLIAALSSTDEHDWQKEEGVLGERRLAGLTARMSPNGRYLAFMSDRRPTGYDNEDAVSGAADEEVYEYRVPQNLETETGTLACASCNPTGARPHGVLDTLESGEGLGLLVDRPQLWGNRWLAGSVPGWTSRTLTQAAYQSRYLTDDGRLFFTSPDPLVAQATNGKEDVYEYEPRGVGPEGAECGPAATTGSGVFKDPSEAVVVQGRKAETELEPAGCVSLISAGGSGRESAFLDASESGEDVFFLTAAPLTSEDQDGSYDVYDAHSCSIKAPCAGVGTTPPAPCSTGDSCEPDPQGAAGAGASPLSSTFQGSGNVAPAASGNPVVVQKLLTRAQKLAAALRSCAKQPKGSRGSCEKRARRLYGPAKKAKKQHAGSKARR